MVLFFFSRASTAFIPLAGWHWYEKHSLFLFAITAKSGWSKAKLEINRISVTISIRPGLVLDRWGGFAVTGGLPGGKEDGPVSWLELDWLIY